MTLATETEIQILEQLKRINENLERVKVILGAIRGNTRHD